MNVGEKLKQLREARGLSPEKLGLLADMSGQYIRKLESRARESITLGTAQKLAKGLGVKPEVFFEGEDINKPQSPKSALSDLEVSISAYIPVYAEVCAGEGMDAIDYVACTRLKPAPETHRAYRVKGLSMDPEVREGDTVIVDTALTPINNDLVVVIIDGKASLKWYKEDNQGNKWLENHFGKYKPEECNIHGVVVEWNHKKR